MARSAERRPVGAGMHMENVRADGEVHAEGHAGAVGGGEQGDVGEGSSGAGGAWALLFRARSPDSAFGLARDKFLTMRQESAGSLAQAELFAVGEAGNLVQERPSLFRHSEAAAGELGFDVLRGIGRA